MVSSESCLSHLNKKAIRKEVSAFTGTRETTDYNEIQAHGAAAFILTALKRFRPPWLGCLEWNNDA